MKLSNRIAHISPSATLALAAKAKAMKKEGLDVIDFSAGQPDFDTPHHIKDAAKEALDKNMTRYTAAAGTPELKNAIVEKYQKKGLDYNTNQVIIGCGGKHILYNIFMCLLNEGDEVILPSPYWTSFLQQILIAGGVPRVVVSNEQNHIDGDAIIDAMNKKTKIIVINSPNNPTGAVTPEETLRAIAEEATKRGIVLISDEVYEAFVYGKNHFSIATISEEIKNNTIIVNAASKTYAMTGWRIGYAVGPEELIKAMGTLQSHSTSNPCSIAQEAARQGILAEQSSVQEMKGAFEKRRDYILERLENIPTITCAKPDGAFYVFPNISATGHTSESFCDELLEKHQVACVPGTAFGAEGFIRMSYACSLEEIKKGLDRIEEFCS